MQYAALLVIRKKIANLYKKVISSASKFPHNLRNLTASYFPHYFRIFSAACLLFLKYLVWGVVYCAIIFNVLENQLFPPNEDSTLRMEILAHPYVSALHETYAKFAMTRNISIAEHEYLLAEELLTYTSPFNPPVLGIQTSPWQEWMQVQTTQSVAEREQFLWGKLLEIYPEYQYAQLKLAILYYQLGDQPRGEHLMQELIHAYPTNITYQRVRERFVEQ